MAEYIDKAVALSIREPPKSNRYYQTNNLDDAYEQGWDEALSYIEKTPTADVAPVVHGRWIGVDSSFWKPTHSSDIPVFRKTYRCSECRRRTAIAENYCPNCGAYMMGENNGKCE